MTDQERQSMQVIDEYARRSAETWQKIYFSQLEERLNRMENNAATAHNKLDEQIKELKEKVDSIKSTINWVYGFAAALAILGGLFVDWIKNKLGL